MFRDRALFLRFASLCRRDALFIGAMAQAKRDEQRQREKAGTTEEREYKLLDGEEPLAARMHKAEEVVEHTERENNLLRNRIAELQANEAALKNHIESTQGDDHDTDSE